MQDEFTELPTGDYGRSDSPRTSNLSSTKAPTFELPNRSRSSTGPESLRSSRFNRGFRSSGLNSVRSEPSRGVRASGVDSIQSTALRSEYSLAVAKGIKLPPAVTDDTIPGTPLLNIIFQNLTVYGLAIPSNVQQTVLSVLEIPFRSLTGTSRKPEKNIILHELKGILRSGELLAVIGRPGSGCTTFLKTIAGELNGLEIDNVATIDYGGIPQSRFRQYFQGEANYCPEYDHHFPHLTVQNTLEFAAGLRAPHNQLAHMTREEYANKAVEILVSTYGLENAVNTQVGNDFIQGVSGGERKRVSIAEMRLTGCSVSCWDQSTRGLDSQTALEFVKSLRIDAKAGCCHIASLYQVSDALLLEFDRVLLLYEGREIYYGPPLRAASYFKKMGWFKPDNQPIGDFLAAVTNPEERIARPGYEDRVPRTAEEFEMMWKDSQLFRRLQRSLDFHNKDKQRQLQLTDSERLLALKSSRSFTNTSSFLATQWTQIRYNLQRLARRLKNDKKSILIVAWGQTVMSLVLGSLFYQTPNNTHGLFSKGGVLFASILLNAIVTITDIFQLFGNRPIIERHASYLFYHPWTEALAGFMINIPLKLITACVFNVILYFLSGLRRKPANFFTFFLFVYMITLVMSSVFRTIGAAAPALPQAFVIVGATLPIFIVYTGFVVPKPYMHVWFKWLTYINPVGYAFESLIGNEFHNRDFNCTADRIVPPYGQSNKGSFACAVRGAASGQAYVSGDAYISANYEYQYTHMWRNLGILFTFLFFFIGLHLYISEKNTASPLSTDTMIFRRGHAPKQSSEKEIKLHSATETPRSSEDLSREKQLGLVHTKTLSWANVCYEVELNNQTKRLLNGITGWIKPGTLTALMGASGAGKTTLLNALAKQLSTGVITGDILLDGQQLPTGFERSCGYVQQQDLHVETTTVREALQFSALLRQPQTVSKAEKFRFVESIIKILCMEEFAEAIVGVPGQGLTTKQRKLLSIGVELAAKPSILLFLDEPTTGLDSQSAYGVISFLRLLANNGMSILCTIHQPSAQMFQKFDRLLLLVKGGQTAYFGEVGKDSRTVIDYFEGKGARKYHSNENPSEYMIEVASQTGMDWPDVWQMSEEAEDSAAELSPMKHKESEDVTALPSVENEEKPAKTRAVETREYALPFPQQLFYVAYRVFQQYWRTPQYVWAKILLACVSSLFIGFTFYKTDDSIQGIQNTLFAIFMQAVVYPPLVFQLIPKFAANRELYEVRERASKTYSWPAFIIAQSIAEIPYQILMGCIVFIVWNYTVLGIQSSEQQVLVLLFMVQFFVWAGTVAQMAISAISLPEVAGMVSVILFVLSLLFSGVIQPPTVMPHFWRFIWRVSPLAHWIGGIAATGLHGRKINCAAAEFATFEPVGNSTCGAYLNQFLNQMHAPGYLLKPDATSNCQYCGFREADGILAQSSIFWSDRWKNLGYGMVYIVFNIIMTVVLYKVFRLGGLGSKIKARKNMVLAKVRAKIGKK